MLLLANIHFPECHICLLMRLVCNICLLLWLQILIEMLQPVVVLPCPALRRLAILLLSLVFLKATPQELHHNNLGSFQLD